MVNSKQLEILNKILKRQLTITNLLHSFVVPFTLKNLCIKNM